MAALLLHGVDNVRYGWLKSTLAQNMSMGTNQYPWTMEETLNSLNIPNTLNSCSQTMRYKKKCKPQGKDNAQNEVAIA